MNPNGEDATQKSRIGKYIQTRRILTPRHGLRNLPQSSSVSLLSRFKGEYYRCPHCKHVTAKNEAKVSGYDSEHSQRHIHCPNCGRIIARVSEGGNLREILKGAGFTVAGGALAFLLYPFLSIYALQLGFFTSLYGTLKILIRPGK